VGLAVGILVGDLVSSVPADIVGAEVRFVIDAGDVGFNVGEAVRTLVGESVSAMSV